MKKRSNYIEKKPDQVKDTSAIFSPSIGPLKVLAPGVEALQCQRIIQADTQDTQLNIVSLEAGDCYINRNLRKEKQKLN